MRTPEIPANEPARLKALRDLRLLDTPAEPEFDRLTRIARHTFGVRITLVSLVDEHRQWFKSAQGLDAPQTGRDVSFCAHGILQQAVFEVPDTLKDPRFHDNLLVTGPPYIRFYAGAQIRTPQGLPLGTLCLIHDQPKALTGQERDILRDLADCVEQELTRYHLTRESHDNWRMQAIIEGTRAGTWERNLQTGESAYNERWAEMLGYQLDELHSGRGGIWADLVHPEDLAYVRDVLQNHIDGKTHYYACMYRMRHREGHWIWVNDRGRIITWTDAGQPEWILGTHIDVTDYKTTELAAIKAQKELTEREKLLRTIIDNIPINIYVKDRDCRKVLANRSELHFLGLEDESEVIGAHDQDLYPGYLVPQSVREDQGVLDDGRVIEIQEDEATDPDGNPVWFRVSKLPLRNEQGDITGIVGISIDVTAEKQAKDHTKRQLEALTILNSIGANTELSLEARFDQALRLGAEYLGLEIAIISRIEDDSYQLRWLSAPESFGLQPGQRFELGNTYCRLVLDNDGELVISHVRESQYRHHPCYRNFGLESYIGVSFDVNDQPYGTLNFSSPHPRADFTEGEKAFVRLMARWVAATLEHEKAQEFLRQLTSEVPGMIFQLQHCSDGGIRLPYCTPGIQSIYGITPDEAGRDPNLLFDAVHAEDAKSFRDSVCQSARRTSNWNQEFRIVHRNGETRWVEGRAAPVRQPDGGTLWHGYIGDIHKRKTVQLTLKESENRLKALFELSPIGIALLDFETGFYIDMNQSFLEQTGYSREELRQKTFWELSPEEYARNSHRQFRDLESNEQFGPVEKEYYRKDGSRYPVLVRGVLVIDHTHGRMIWSIIEDISEQKRIERLKDEFVSTVSHELRTPLTSITGSLTLLNNAALGELPPKVEEITRIAEKNSKRLSWLVNDLLDMDKLVSGKMTFEWRVLDTGQLLRHAVEQNRTFAEQYGVGLVCEGDSQLLVEADPHRLEQVITNLVSNAVKFSPRGGVVDVSLEAEENIVRISVRDQGPGISKAFQPRLFQRFTQADASDSRQKGGTGLGLAISRELTHQMGGEIGFETDVGVGTRFFVELPRVYA